jgi:hypothetical protein
VGSIPLDWINLGSWLITIGSVTLISSWSEPERDRERGLNDEARHPKLRLRLRRKPLRGLVDVAPVRSARLEVENLTVRFSGRRRRRRRLRRNTKWWASSGRTGRGGHVVGALTGFTKPTAGDPETHDGRAVRAPSGARAGIAFVESLGSSGAFGRRGLHAGAGEHTLFSPLRHRLARATCPSADLSVVVPSSSGFTTTSIASRASCRTVDGDGGDHPRWLRRHRCCCSTSRQPVSTP